MLAQVLFVVWRESVEALLIVGLLSAWLQRRPDAAAGRRWLWAGVATGLLVALLLGGAILGFAEAFEGEEQEVFQLGMTALAAALIVQMVFWMRRHGPTMKGELESGLGREVGAGNGWGILALVALAIAREGSETVVFLWGLGSSVQGLEVWRFALATAIGLALAVGTYALLQMGTRMISWRHFFRFSEVALLLLGGALLVSSIERAISLGLLPALLDPAWDSSGLLDDSGPLGGLVAALTGYRAHPALTVLLALAAYWVVVVGVMRALAPPARPTRAAAATTR